MGALLLGSEDKSIMGIALPNYIAALRQPFDNPQQRPSFPSTCSIASSVYGCQYRMPT